MNHNIRALSVFIILLCQQSIFHLSFNILSDSYDRNKKSNKGTTSDDIKEEVDYVQLEISSVKERTVLPVALFAKKISPAQVPQTGFPV